MADLNQLAADYERAAAEADTTIAAAQADLLATLRAYANGIAHKRTGKMAASLTVVGPAIRRGVIEGAVVAGVTYAEFEVARGGDHDYAGRTIREQAGVIEAWAEGVGVKIVKLVGGVS